MLDAAAQRRSVSVAGAEISYTTMGEGPPVVLLHGLGEASVVWFRNVEKLSEQFSVYAPDLWGHGRSADIGPYSLDTGIRFLLGFLDALNIGSAHVVGNSLGGLVTINTALHSPERIRSMVLEGSAGLGRELPAFLRVMTVPLLGELMAMPRRGSLKRLMRLLMRHPEEATEEFLSALLHERALPGRSRAMLRMLRHGASPFGVKGTYQFTHRLGELRVPALVAWGRQDPIFPLAHAERAAELIPNAILDLYEDCGHWPHLEYHARFNESVARFFAAADR